MGKPSKRCRNRKTCQHKVLRGNVYDLKSSAQREARRIEEDSGVYVEAYKCDNCGRYHVGKPPPQKGDCSPT